jgi:hypothetical protein
MPTDMLVELGSKIELFHTPAGAAFADVLIDGHRETWAVRSKRLRDWLRRRYYQATGAAPCLPELRSALDLLEARAQFDAPEQPVHVRLAEQAGRIYLDLADAHWRAVEVGPHGWQVIERFLTKGRGCTYFGRCRMCGVCELDALTTASAGTRTFDLRFLAAS